MSIWAIGDVHGCARTLERLLARLDLDEARDSLWFVGDLVNRGPASLAALRLVRHLEDSLGPRLVCVLGNHDLHLLALSMGFRRAKRLDTLDSILEAPDREQLLSWLRARPFVHCQENWILVHAGLPSGTNEAEIKARSRDLESALQGNEPGLLLGGGKTESEAKNETSRLPEQLAQFTRMRMLDRHGKLLDYSGPPESAPDGAIAWYDMAPRGCSGEKIVTGHWAALGLRLEPDLIALDTACVWGGSLTAVRLDDRSVVQQPVCDSPLP